MKTDRVAQLLADADKTESAALKAGLAAAAKVEQEAKEKKVVADYQRLRSALNSTVDSLKSARETEKFFHTRVKKADVILQQFMKDGDFEAAHKAMNAADIYVPSRG